MDIDIAAIFTQFIILAFSPRNFFFVLSEKCRIIGCSLRALSDEPLTRDCLRAPWFSITFKCEGFCLGSLSLKTEKDNYFDAHYMCVLTCIDSRNMGVSNTQNEVKYGDKNILTEPGIIYSNGTSSLLPLCDFFGKIIQCIFLSSVFGRSCQEDFG